MNKFNEMLAFDLTESGDSDKLLGLACCYILIRRKDANIDYVRRFRALDELFTLVVAWTRGLNLSRVVSSHLRVPHTPNVSSVSVGV